MEINVKNGATHRIAALFIDEAFAGITGATIALWIRRKSDWKWHNPGDSADWVTSKYDGITMTEKDNGFYYYDFVANSANHCVNDDTYYVYYKCSDTLCTNQFGMEVIKAGGSIDYIAKLLRNKFVVSVADNQAVIYDTDGVTEIERWNLLDSDLITPSSSNIFSRVPV